MEAVENRVMAMRKVLRRPMMSEINPPTNPPRVMEAKYQKVTVPMSFMVSPQLCISAGAIKPKFQLSICSQKYATMMIKNTALWRPVTARPSK